MDASYWADVSTKALSVVRRWEAEHERSNAVFAALVEFHSRLQLFDTTTAPGALGALVDRPDTLPLLHAKHVRGVENLMVALHEGIVRRTTLQDELSRVHASVWERHTKCRSNQSEPMQMGSLLGGRPGPVAG